MTASAGERAEPAVSRARWTAAVASGTALVLLAALMPAVGGIHLGGTDRVADSAGAVVAFTRVVTAALLLAVAGGAAGAEMSTGAAAFAFSGVAALAASAVQTLVPEVAGYRGLSAEALELDARVLLPLGLAVAVALPWERLHVRQRTAFGISALVLAAAAVPLVLVDLAPARAGLDPDVSRVVVTAVAALVIGVGGRTSDSLWRWALVAAVTATAAAWARIVVMPLSLGWYLSLGLSLTSAAVVLVGVGADAGRAARQVAVTRVRRSLEDRIAHMALHDDVTGLPNARNVRRRVDETLAEGRDAALVVLALDGLDDVLDAFGQQAVDDLLRAVAARLAASVVGTRGVLARVGDEEMGLLLAGSPRDLLALSGQAIAALEMPFEVGGLALTVGAVAGSARAPRDGTDGELVLRRAGLAARAARRREREALEYRDGLEAHGPDQVRLLSELRPAIAHGELVLFYQAKARVRDRAVVGVEALVRWRHPSRGLVPPADFIPLAERSDVITELTVWAMDSAARQAVAWRRAGLPFSVAVNLPARSVADRELPAQVEDVLDRSGADPAALRLEVTESAAMRDIQRSLRRLQALRGMGVQLAIDDFGTGYSSLAYLARLPIDEVKIDASFVRAMRTDAASATIVRSAVELCHHLGYTATAEGAEDMETWGTLGDMGCDLVQGYVVSRPLPPDDLVAHLRSSGWLPQA